jgi:hypothetical protein
MNIGPNECQDHEAIKDMVVRANMDVAKAIFFMMGVSRHNALSLALGGVQASLGTIALNILDENGVEGSIAQREATAILKTLAESLKVLFDRHGIGSKIHHSGPGIVDSN